MKYEAKLTPEWEIQYQTELMTATPLELTLAWQFAAAAFHGREEKFLEIATSGRIPPIYLSQAVACCKNITLRRSIISLLVDIGKN